MKNKEKKSLKQKNSEKILKEWKSILINTPIKKGQDSPTELLMKMRRGICTNTVASKAK